MAERLDALTPTPGKDGKTFFRRIGVAWPTKNGGWRVVLDALPLPSLGNDGQIETTILLMPPKDKPANGDEPF